MRSWHLNKYCFTFCPNVSMSKISAECGQLHSELFGRRHSTLQLHGLFALAKLLFSLLCKWKSLMDTDRGGSTGAAKGAIAPRRLLANRIETPGRSKVGFITKLPTYMIQFLVSTNLALLSFVGHATAISRAQNAAFSCFTCKTCNDWTV